MKKTYKKLMAATLTMLAACAFFFIGCNKENPELDTPFVNVDQPIVDAPAGGGELTLTITANRPWKLTDNMADDKWLIADKPEGSGDAVITLTFSPNTDVSREADLRIATSTVYVDVRIVQPGAVASDVIYFETVGTMSATTTTAMPRWPSVTEYTGWNTSGLGASAVTYTAEGGGASVRGNQASGTYAGASKSGNVMIAATGGSFLVNGIDPMGMTNMTLSFGSNETSETLKLYHNTGGSDWTESSYTKTATGWDLATVSFTIPEGSAVLNLKYTASATTYGARLDDIKLVGSGGSAGDLRVSPASLDFIAGGESKTFTVTSAAAWTATSSEPSWLTVSPNNGTVTVTAAANPGVARTATITVTGAGTRTVNVTQAAYVAPQTYLFEDWESGPAGTGKGFPAAINGWTFSEVKGGGDMIFELRDYQGNKYAYASLHNGKAGTDYELWLISPPLDITNAASKTVSFKTVGGYFQGTSLLEAYILNSATAGVTNGTKLTARIAESTDIPSGGTYTDWIPSGDINLSAYSGVKYIGFRYVAKGGSSNSTTYEIDDFLFGGDAPKVLTVNPSPLSFPVGGDTKSFTITSNTTWSVTSSEPTWVTTSPTSGSDNNTVNVTAQANPGAARSATITVSGAGVTDDKKVLITQTGVSSGGGDPISVAWDFSGISPGVSAVNNSPCTISPTITGSVEIVENLTQSNFGSPGSPAAKSWGGATFTTNTASNTSTTDIYATVKIKSASKNLSLSTLSGNIRRSNTGPTNTAVFYKLDDGAFVAGVDIPNGTKVDAAGNPITADLSSVAGLQNIPAGTVITIKFVPYIASGNTGTWYFNSGGTLTTALKIEGIEE
jgi:hypothetical protein